MYPLRLRPPLLRPNGVNIFLGGGDQGHDRQDTGERGGGEKETEQHPRSTSER